MCCLKTFVLKKYKNTWRQIDVVTWAKQGKNRHRDKWLVNHQHKWREMWAAIKNNIKINTELFKHKKWPCQEIICVTLLIVDEHTRTHTYNWHPTCLKRNSQSVAADVTAWYSYLLLKQTHTPSPQQIKSSIIRPLRKMSLKHTAVPVKRFKRRRYVCNNKE